MDTNKEWINLQKERILNDEDKTLFYEVEGCFLGGFYRAAYVMCWVNLIESIKRKIQELSGLEVVNAQNALEEIKKAESERKSTDIIIIQKASICQIIEENEVSDLNYLWEKRCLFVHPYEKQPDIEELKHIINESIKISLGKEFLFNRQYIEDYCNNLVLKPYFLPDEKEYIINYATEKIKRVPEKLHPFFFKTFLFQLGKIKDDVTKKRILTKLRIHLIVLLNSTTKPLSDADWTLENKALDYPIEMYLGCVHKSIWGKLPDRIKDILIEFFLKTEELEKIHLIKEILIPIIKDINIIEGKYKKSYYEKIDNLNFSFSVNSYAYLEDVNNRIIKELRTFKYDVSNDVIDYLYSNEGKNHIKGLNDESLRELGNAIHDAAQNSHWKSQGYIESVLNNQTLYKDSFKVGIAWGYIFGYVENRIILHSNTLYDFASIMNGLIEQEKRNLIYTEINSKIDEMNKNDAYRDINNEDLDFQSNETLKSINWVPGHKELFENLILKIKSLKTLYERFFL